MDGFAESMIARGPTLGTDRETATGSLHVLALPGVAAVHEFVALEPNNRAGVYREHVVRRFQNRPSTIHVGLLEPGDRAAVRGRRPLAARPARPSGDLPSRLARAAHPVRALTTLDGAEPAGVALALQAPDRAAVDALMNDERTGLGALPEVEIHNWEFGGRR